jgi:hypothetical protein
MNDPTSLQGSNDPKKGVEAINLASTPGANIDSDRVAWSEGNMCSHSRDSVA